MGATYDQTELVRITLRWPYKRFLWRGRESFACTEIAPIDSKLIETQCNSASRALPKLATLREDDIVVIDNLGGHGSKIVRRLIRAAGAKPFFLQKYSPDLNSIEHIFAKLKRLLRKAEVGPRLSAPQSTALAPITPRSTPTSSRKRRIWANLNASRFKALAWPTTSRHPSDI